MLLILNDLEDLMNKVRQEYIIIKKANLGMMRFRMIERFAIKPRKDLLYYNLKKVASVGLY